MTVRYLLAGLLMLGGCASQTAPHVIAVPVRPVAGVSDDIRTPEKCARAAGWWTKVGRDGNEACVIEARDRGKPCANDAECETFCAAPIGATEGAKAIGTCASGTVGHCDVRHVKNGRAKVACIE